ncbi:mucin [Arabidopsis thaliana]|uniref:Mucin n=1 Tax=Arabidopsis thaliana TaxID=3702 RepID=A0A1P8AQL4_ARATH|nr:mucin [Arabidopsis thaliana]NP_001321350.1 mucin [Arabidopsis thaliana]ANM58948.1 mucin [Arabidopsis thaliana]ANM58951.1 mucin [Arabidopsis thaliana]|eukprot:NP_001321347.1 mucin [Arabidopsis thaliana]
MGPESKGRAWFSKIYNKLENLLVEVDSFTSQSTLCLKSSEPPRFEYVRGESKEVAEDHSSNVQGRHDRVASPRSESPSDPPSHQNFDIPGHVLVEKRVQGDILKENVVQRDSFEDNSSASSSSDGEIESTSPLHEEYCDAYMTSTTTLSDEEQLVSDEESQIFPDGERLSTSPLLEEYHDANLTSAASVGDEEPIVTDKESHITKSLSNSPSCNSPSDSPPCQNFDILGHVRVEERVQGDILVENIAHGENSSASSLDGEETLSTSPLLEELCDANLTSTSTLGGEEPIVTDDESQITNTLTPQKFSAENSSVFPGEESVQEVRVESSLSDEEILSKSPLLEEHCDANLTSDTTLGDEKPIITDDESWISNSLTSQKSSAGNSWVFSGEDSVEEVKVKSCRDVVSTESQSTQSSMESFGTVVKCNDGPVLAALGCFRDNDSSLNPLVTKVPDENMRSSNADNPDDVINNCKSDVTPLDTKDIAFQKEPSYVNDTVRVRIMAELCGMESREDPLYVEDSELYAIHLRTKKLRSFKRKVLDVLTSKRRREKEYEQLPIWYGDAGMGSDLATKEESQQVEATDSKSSLLLESEDSQWELL